MEPTSPRNNPCHPGLPRRHLRSGRQRQARDRRAPRALHASVRSVDRRSSSPDAEGRLCARRGPEGDPPDEQGAGHRGDDGPAPPPARALADGRARARLGRAHDEAHRLEHALSPVVEERLAKMLGMPSTCPHGNPIPGMPAPEAHHPIPLSHASSGQTLVVDRITEEAEADRQLLRFLWESGIRPGHAADGQRGGAVCRHHLRRARGQDHHDGLGRLAQDLGLRPEGASAQAARPQRARRQGGALDV